MCIIGVACPLFLYTLTMHELHVQYSNNGVCVSVGEVKWSSPSAVELTSPTPAQCRTVMDDQLVVDWLYYLALYRVPFVSKPNFS